MYIHYINRRTTSSDSKLWSKDDELRIYIRANAYRSTDVRDYRQRYLWLTNTELMARLKKCHSWFADIDIHTITSINPSSNKMHGRMYHPLTFSHVSIGSF